MPGPACRVVAFLLEKRQARTSSNLLRKDLKQRQTTEVYGLKFLGAHARTRTWDHGGISSALYQLSYVCIIKQTLYQKCYLIKF